MTQFRSDPEGSAEQSSVDDDGTANADAEGEQSPPENRLAISERLPNPFVRDACRGATL